MASNNSNTSQHSPMHILKLSKEQKREFLNSFDRVFTDIDGVIWNMEHIVPGAADGFSELKKIGKDVTFITNNSVRPIENCVKRLNSLNLHVDAQDIWHPAQSTVDYLKKIKFNGLLYVIASTQFKDVLRAAGFTLIDGPNKILAESFEVLAQHIFDQEPVRAVIIDVDFNLSSPKLLRAHVYLRHPDCQLISGATDMLLPVRKDFSIIGPGPFAKVLIEASNKRAITLGKPGKELGEMLIERYNIKKPDRVLMIGDMLEQDVGFGKVCGFQTLVVLSGGCHLDDLKNVATSSLPSPDYYANSVKDFVELIHDLA